MTQDPYNEALRQETVLDRIRGDITTHANQLEATTRAREEAVKACTTVARAAYQAGMPESHIARDMRVNRRTVRRWLGKPE